MNKYGSQLLKLPVPKLVVFYNGVSEKEDKITLRLSDSFPEGSEPDIEITVQMININHGHNQDIMEACRPLREYSWLIQEIRNNLGIEDTEIDKAIDKAVKDIPKDFLIRPFLDAHRAEVKEMLLTEYNEAEAMELFKKDGKREQIIEDIQRLMETLDFTPKHAMDALKIPVAEQEVLIKLI